jgi:hypothetical protein
MCQSTNLSAFDEAMGATVLKHGKLTDREREIAETVARAAYRWALREQVEIWRPVSPMSDPTRTIDLSNRTVVKVPWAAMCSMVLSR